MKIIELGNLLLLLDGLAGSDKPLCLWRWHAAVGFALEAHKVIDFVLLPYFSQNLSRPRIWDPDYHWGNNSDLLVAPRLLLRLLLDLHVAVGLLVGCVRSLCLLAEKYDVTSFTICPKHLPWRAQCVAIVPVLEIRIHLLLLLHSLCRDEHKLLE